MLSELVINRRMMVGNLYQPMASQLVRGDKCSEGRPTGLPPKGLWCMFAVPQAPHQEGSIQNPRTVRLDNPNTLLMSKKIKQFRVGMIEVQKAGTPRPDTGYPHECFEGVVFFDRCLTQEETTSAPYSGWVRSYRYNWRRCCSIVFSSPIRKLTRSKMMMGSHLFPLDNFSCKEGSVWEAVKVRLGGS